MNPQERHPDPIISQDFPTDEAINKALGSLILSASGWRKVFNFNGDEEGLHEELTAADSFLTAAMGMSYSQYIKDITGKENPLILLGMDSRPTGPAMQDLLARVFLSRGVKIRLLGIVAAPEIMAYTGSSKDLDGFCYISASHNPPGHNGVKFGLSQGGVLGGEQAADLIGRFKEFTSRPDNLQSLSRLSIDSSQLEAVYEKHKDYKTRSYKSYLQFNRQIAAGSEKNIQSFQQGIKETLIKRPLGILGELNGSARALSIDREYLESMGIHVTLINETPGKFVHPIVPEGESLDLCRRELEKLHHKDASYLLGYVPDCDGDRGNLVYYSPKQGGAKILQAQEVFALSVLSELCDLKRKNPQAKVAVSVNGPTSLRIDRIAEIMGAQVYRAEVGEANVVNLAEELRSRGFRVPILGEGSNGGNITYPARVRDPLNTLTAMIKLLSIRSTRERPGLFELWCRKSGQSHLYRSDFSFDEILASLPSFNTTSAFDQRALMKIKTSDHGELKRKYEKIFLDQWKEKSLYLKETWGITSWKEINTERTKQREGIGSSCRTAPETGGLKIQFYNDRGQSLAYLWMRGSQTEPVFRIMADCSGKLEGAEPWMLQWQRSMVDKADRM